MAVTAADVERMTSKLWLTTGADTKTKRSTFWVLMVLASVIASAGVVGDSTATVIGAMIVAPMMTPILGTALAIVQADRRRLLDSVAFVVVGTAAVIAISYIVGLTHQLPVDASTNGQVASRVAPKLIDLLAALATGLVGAFALVRSDVSDTLPGVAIAISLVPPLCVVGLTLESGAPGEALGALILFGTNVAAIIATGVATLLFFRVREVAKSAGLPVGRLAGLTLVIVAGMVLLVAVPLTIGSREVLRQEQLTAEARHVTSAWADKRGWELTDVSYRQGVLNLLLFGPPPAPTDTASLRAALDAAGLKNVRVRVSLVVGGSRDLPSLH